MGFGTFDAVHPGHLHYLNSMKMLGDELIVVVARDKNVSEIKSKKPHFNEQVRLAHVRETGIPDQVMLGDLNDFYVPIREYQPDVIGLGYDQRTDEDQLRTLFPDVQIVRLNAFKPELYKSSILKKRMD